MLLFVTGKSRITNYSRTLMLEHTWDYENLFETGLVRDNNGGL